MKLIFLIRYYLSSTFMVLSLWLMPKSEYKQALLKRIYKLKNEAIMQAAIRGMIEEIRE